MDFKCTKCGNCCEATVFVDIDDIELWLDKERFDILACLTWHHVRGRKPPDLLFIPKKMHLIGHSLLRGLYMPEEMGKDNTCIFYKDGDCMIYAVRPTVCKEFPKSNLNFDCPGIKRETITEDDVAEMEEFNKDREKQKLLIYDKREMLSKLIKEAKKEASPGQLARLLWGVNKVAEKKKTLSETKG